MDSAIVVHQVQILILNLKFFIIKLFFKKGCLECSASLVCSKCLKGFKISNNFCVPENNQTLNSLA